MSQFQDIARQELPQDTILALVESEPLRFAPGTAMSYSNTGYFLLGRIIEKASGHSYAAYVEEHLFEPAGMDDSYYCDEYAVSRHKAHGYNSLNEKEGFRHRLYGNHDWPYAAGSLCSTAGDLVTWTRDLHRGEVLSDSMYQKMTTPGRLDDGTGLRYAMGLRAFQAAGRPTIGHGGAISGFLSATRYYTGSGLIIVVLQNTYGPRYPQTLADSLARLVLGPSEEPSATPYEGDLSELAGRYVGPSRGGVTDLRIEASGEALLAREAGSKEADTLRHASGLTWRHAADKYPSAESTYRFIRSGEQIVELRLDVVGGHYVLRQVSDR